MKHLIGLFMLLLPALFCFAGDTILISNTNSPGVIDWLALNWKEVAMIVIAFLEFLLRVLPTEHDYSIIHFLLRLLNVLVPNRAKKKSDGNYVFTIAKVKKNE